MEIIKNGKTGTAAVSPTCAKHICAHAACPKQVLQDLELLMTSRLFFISFAELFINFLSQWCVFLPCRFRVVHRMMPGSYQDLPLIIHKML